MAAQPVGQMVSSAARLAVRAAYAANESLNKGAPGGLPPLLLRQQATGWHRKEGTGSCVGQASYSVLDSALRGSNPMQIAVQPGCNVDAMGAGWVNAGQDGSESDLRCS